MGRTHHILAPMKKLLFILILVSLSTLAHAQDDPGAAARLTAKITVLEEENRRLNGRIEELEHNLAQMRVQAEAQAAKPATPEPVVTGVRPLMGQAELGGETSAADGSKVSRPNPYVMRVNPEENVTSVTAEAELDDIFQSVEAEDYKTAKPALKAFVQKYPGTSASGEAYFWLGEIAWSERDYNTAAINYLKGYKEAPRGEKAPENILKMALTLKELRKNEEACKYIERFIAEFPDAHRDLRNKANSAKIELGCK